MMSFVNVQTQEYPAESARSAQVVRNHTDVPDNLLPLSHNILLEWQQDHNALLHLRSYKLVLLYCIVMAY